MDADAVAKSDLVRDQAGVLTRDQCRTLDVSPAQWRAQLDAQRWRALNDAVIVTHNGPLTRPQMLWAAMLSARPPAAISGVTTFETLGVNGFDDPAVHLLVGKSAKPLPVHGVEVVIHETRRPFTADILPRLLPMTTVERATIDAAIWAPDVKTATRIAVAPVQQRFTTASRLREQLETTGRVRYRAVLSAFFADLEGGAQALSEVEFLRWCRRHGFPKPRTQVRLDTQGRRRYLDATFDLRDGSRLIVEIDGGVHLTLTTRWADTAKDNDAMLANQRTLRFPSVAIYTDDARAIRQLRDALSLRPKAASL